MTNLPGILGRTYRVHNNEFTGYVKTNAPNIQERIYSVMVRNDKCTGYVRPNAPGMMEGTYRVHNDECTGNVRTNVPGT